MSRKLAFEIKNPAEAYWRFRSDRANGVVSDRGITEVQFQAVTSFLQSSFPAPSRNTNREDMLQRLQTCISAICVLRHSLRLHRAHIFTLHCASGVQTDLSSNGIQQHGVPAWPAGHPIESQHGLLVVQGSISMACWSSKGVSAWPAGRPSPACPTLFL